MKKISKTRVYLYAVLSMMIWGMTFVIYDKLIHNFGFNPVTVIFFRLILSSLVLLIVAKFFLNSCDKIQKSDYVSFLLLASFEPFFYFIGESYGIKLTSPAIASVIIATIPLFAPIFAFYVFRERITLKNIIGLIISTFGLLILTLKSDLSLVKPWQGFAFLFISVFSTLCYGVFIKKLSKRYSPISIVAYQNTIGIFYFLPLFFFLDFQTINSIVLNTESVLSIIYLAIFGSSLAFIMYTIVIREVGMAKANVLTNIIPIFTAVFSFFLIHEEFTMKKIIGILVILVGLFLSQMNDKRVTN